MTEKMLTALEFSEAIGVPYATVALWLRRKKVEGAQQVAFGGLKFWQIPQSSVALYKGENKRPKRGRPPGDSKGKKATSKHK